MLPDPTHKYHPFPPVQLIDRQWPNRTLTQAPIWMSTDLRDGNQALFEPMNADQKFRLFCTLCDIGFKEIEVAFPAASQTDYDFVRQLIEGRHIPNDVTIEVLTQAREPLIRRTMQSLHGVKRAIVHVYNATSKPFRDKVFGLSRSHVIAMAVNAVHLIKQLASEQPNTDWVLEYSPETFSATELDFSLDICNAVTDAWGGSVDKPIILNLPSTVEVSTPNIYADQIEWMHRHLANRDSIILSVHPHNDRGTAVAAAELAMMAGAERVEGCLFGNGERTGNVDLVTLALNLYSQGITPNLNFSDINAIARTAEQCTQLPIHPRHPYVGDLVFTSFSGSHQDAIKKVLSTQCIDMPWNVPYLPIDPADVGRGYDAIIRINSQSGKGGIAWLLEKDLGVVLPRRMLIEFSVHVQQYTDNNGGEILADDIWRLFSEQYLTHSQPLRFIAYHLFEQDSQQGINLSVVYQTEQLVLIGIGNGPIDATVNALREVGLALNILSFEERATQRSVLGGEASAMAIIEATQPGCATQYGAGLNTNTITAAIMAVLNAANRVINHQIGRRWRAHHPLPP